MNKIITRLLLLAFVSMCFAAAPASRPVEAPSNTKYGGISWPAPGNFELDEGTVELWMRADFDTDTMILKRNEQPSPTLVRRQMSVFDFQYASTAEPFHYWWGFVNGHLAMVGYVQPQQSYTWLPFLHWKPIEWHYIAWSWRGNLRSVFMDGQHFATKYPEDAIQGEGHVNRTIDVPVEGPVRGTLTGARLHVGMQHSYMSIDEVRISSIARPPEEIERTFAAGNAPTLDIYTLLLDHCDGGPAEVISGFSGEKGGTLAGTYKMVDGRFGKAIRLWDE
jgi:hypothetical protein